MAQVSLKSVYIFIHFRPFKVTTPHESESAGRFVGIRVTFAADVVVVIDGANVTFLEMKMRFSWSQSYKIMFKTFGFQ